MAISIVDTDVISGFVNVGNTIVLSTTAPSAGDLVIGIGCINGPVSSDIVDLPSELSTALSALDESWTTGSDGNAKLAWLEAAGTEGTDYTFGNNAGSASNEEICGGVITISGHNTGTPFRVTPADRHSLFVNDNSVVVPPSIGGSANSEPDLEPGDLAVMFHYMHENPFNNGGTPAGPTGTTLSAQVTGNRRNLFIATRVLQAGDIVSGTYTPDAFQHVYDAGEGAHNSYVAIVVVRQALVAPTYTQIPNVSSRSDVAYTLTAEMTANCSLYAVAVEKDVTAPTIAQVKAGNDSGDTAAIAAANKAFSEDTADSMELGGTLAFPIHDVYAVAANSAGDATLVSLTGEQLEPAIGKQHVTLSLVGITGVANTNPAEVTAPGHGFATGQQIRIFGVTGMTEVNSPAPVNGIADFHTLTSIDGNTFSLDGVDATSFPAYSGGGHVAPGVSTLETVSPPASDGDIAVADSVTRPGGYAVTFHTDGTFSYAANGDDSRQSILVAVYDVSAATLSPAATSAANNAGPTLIDAPIPVQLWRQGIAIDPLDFSALVGDREGDVLSWALVGAPAWMLLTDAVLSGTPDIGVTSDNVVLTATDSLGYSTDFTVDYSIADTAIVPDVVGTSLAAAIDALEAAGFDNIAFASTQTGAVAIGEVALQDPSATTVHSTDDPVLLTVKETIAVAVAASPDVAGVVSTRRPIPSPEIVWAAVPDYSNQPQAVAFSEDVRGLLSGAGAATAVISVADVSGDSAAALGLSISGGDNLASGAATLGAGVFRLQATFGGVDYLSGSFTFSVVSNVSDTLAPTEPLPESWAAVGTDQVDLTILPPSDPISPASTVSGLNEVEIHSRQGGGSYSLLTTKAVGPGLSLQLVRSTIGSVGGVPSSSQSGPDYSLTAQSGGQNGRGLIGVADGLEVWAGSVSGDFDVSVKVEELIGVVGAFSAAYLMVRESLATDAKVIAASSRTDDSDGSNVRCQMQYRDTTGGNLISETAVQNVFGDRYLRIKRQGNTLTAYYWQPGLTGWVPLGARTIPMTDAVQVCLSCAPRSNDSSTLTAQFREFSVTNLPLISHSDLGLTPNSEYYYKARARDVDLNLGDFGPEVSVVLSGTGGGGSARYTDVTFSPPVLSSPTTYTTYTSLPSSFAGSFRSGVEHCGGLVHRFVGNATNPGDLLIDLSGDAGHACIYPIWVQDWRHVYIIGVNALMSTQSGCEVGQLDNRDDSGTKNHYPRLPAGAYNIKSDIVGHLFVEGCYWDANGHEGDYLIYRNKRGVPADRPNMIVTFQNCMFVGNEGQPQAVHSDIFHNQGDNDPVTHPSALRYENCIFESGQNGMVIQPKSLGQQLALTTRRCVFEVNSKNQSPSAQVNTGLPMGIARGSLNDLSITDTWYGKEGTSRKAFRYNSDFGPNRDSTSIAIGAPNSGGGIVANPGLNYYQVGVGSHPDFVEQAHLGFNYVSPH